MPLFLHSHQLSFRASPEALGKGTLKKKIECIGVALVNKAYRFQVCDFCGPFIWIVSSPEEINGQRHISPKSQYSPPLAFSVSVGGHATPAVMSLGRRSCVCFPKHCKALCQSLLYLEKHLMFEKNEFRRVSRTQGDLVF